MLIINWRVIIIISVNVAVWLIMLDFMMIFVVHLHLHILPITFKPSAGGVSSVTN